MDLNLYAMEIHFELTDTEFEEKFENCSLDSKVFTHEAHLRLAWIHIKNYGIDKAIDNVRNQIQKYVELLGASDKYNETLTIAGVRIVYHFILKSKRDNFKDFIEENKRLKNHFKLLVASHYQTDIFNSVAARKKYLHPELLPFD